MVVIEDALGPTSIAGLMGGERSEVEPQTSRVLLEVATWNGPNIHRSSWALGLRSEASARFEKGLAPEQCIHAQAVATQLMIELCGATVAPGTIDVGGVPDAPAADPPAQRSRAGDPRRGGDARAPGRDPRGARLPVPAGRGRTAGVRAGGAAQRRQPRGRPDRGGRPHRRPRAPARDPAGAAWGGRTPDPRPAGASPRRGPARRAGAERDRRLELCRAGRARSPAPAGRPRAAPRGEAREPALGGPLDHAPHADGLALGRRPSQRPPQRARPRPVRVGHRLPRPRGRSRGRRTPRPRGPAERRPGADLLARAGTRGGLLRRQGAARSPARSLPRPAHRRSPRPGPSCTLPAASP